MAKQNNIPVKEEKPQRTLPFTWLNYVLVLAGVLLIAVGMILMIGGGSDDRDIFNDKMFDFQHITLSVILILMGFVVEIVAIFVRKK
ncbi:MAG: DUF3098 domain-containing protein [Bacteroidales bacterium]|nr:DUF3098 domain-containing protein [Bacteroidales bacterium]